MDVDPKPDDRDVTLLAIIALAELRRKPFGRFVVIVQEEPTHGPAIYFSDKAENSMELLDEARIRIAKQANY